MKSLFFPSVNLRKEGTPLRFRYPFWSLQWKILERCIVSLRLVSTYYLVASNCCISLQCITIQGPYNIIRGFNYISCIQKREVLLKRYDIPDAPTFFGDCKKYPTNLEISVVHYNEKPDFWDELVRPRFAEFPEDDGGILLIWAIIPSAHQNTKMNEKKDK